MSTEYWVPISTRGRTDTHQYIHLAVCIRIGYLDDSNLQGKRYIITLHIRSYMCVAHWLDVGLSKSRGVELDCVRTRVEYEGIMAETVPNALSRRFAKAHSHGTDARDLKRTWWYFHHWSSYASAVIKPQAWGSPPSVLNFSLLVLLYAADDAIHVLCQS